MRYLGLILRKMKQNKFLIIIFMFAVCSLIVYAGGQGESIESGLDLSSKDFDWSTVDWDTMTTYSDFKWEYVDWNEVDYNKLDYSIAYIYIQSGFDHNRVDIDKYFSDLGCSGCTFDKGDYEVEYSNKGISHAGDYVSIPGNYPSNPLFIATGDGITVVILGDVDAELEIPATDSFTLDTDGTVVILKEGAEVNGKLSFKNGQAYLDRYDKVIINNVYIDTNYEAAICFDKCIDSKSYKMVITFTDTTLEYKSDFEYSSAVLEFFQGNPYFNVEESDVLKMRIGEYDPYGVDQGFVGNLKITNRDDNGLIPEVELEIKKGIFRLQSGVIRLDIDAETQEIETSWTSCVLTDATSSPLSLKLIGESSFFLTRWFLGKEEKKQILISNYNEFATADMIKSSSAIIAKSIDTRIYDERNQLLGYIDPDNPNIVLDENGNRIGTIKGNKVRYDDSALEAWSTTTENYAYAPGLVSERLYFNYQPYYTFYEASVPIAAGDDDALIDDSIIIKRISDAINSLPEDVRDSIEGIVLYSEEGFIQHRIEKGHTLAEAGSTGAYAYNGVITLKDTFLTEAIIHHEAAHIYENMLYKEYEELVAHELYEIKLKYDRNNDGEVDKKYIDDFENEKAIIEQKYSTGLYSTDAIYMEPMSYFQHLWREVHGEDYNSYSEISNGILRTWEDDSNDADHGCTKPYGEQSFREDVATFVEYAYSNPDYLIELTTSDDGRYAKKIILLYEYGFIDEEGYKTIMVNIPKKERERILKEIGEIK